MHRILDFKPEPEHVIIERLHNRLSQLMEAQFPDLRKSVRESFGSDEATVITFQSHQGGDGDVPRVPSKASSQEPLNYPIFSTPEYSQSKRRRFFILALTALLAGAITFVILI